ncbi:MAG: hypothetical protein ACRDQB_02055, partial [Thermocrispum sp.]
MENPSTRKAPAVSAANNPTPHPAQPSGGTGGRPPGNVTETGTAKVKRGMAEMLKGGVIMDVV